MSDVQLHASEVSGAITAELVRLTLGGRGPSRSELRTDGRLARGLAGIGKAVAAAFNPYALALESIGRLVRGEGIDLPSKTTVGSTPRQS